MKTPFYLFALAAALLPATRLSAAESAKPQPKYQVAENTLFYSESKPSAIILPIAPDAFTRTTPTQGERRE